MARDLPEVLHRQLSDSSLMLPTCVRADSKYRSHFFTTRSKDYNDILTTRTLMMRHATSDVESNHSAGTPIASYHVSPNSPVQHDGTWVVASPTSLRSRGPIMSPVPDVAADKHLRITLAVNTRTEELVAASLTKAIASVRSGEVSSVPVKRVLHISRHDPPSVASSVRDLTPKKAVAPHAKVLYF